jgi:hypothetical protein
MSGKTENRLGQKETPAPVIPFVPKMGSQNTIPPIPDGKPITKENRGSLPIQFWLTVEDKSSIPSTKTQLPVDLDDGVALTFLGGKAQLKTIASPHQKVSPFSFWGIPFLLVFGIACVAITAVMFLATNKKETQTTMAVAPRATPIVTPALKAANNLAKSEKTGVKVDGLLPKENKLLEDEEEERLGRFPIYKNSSEIYKLIENKEEAIDLYKEAVQMKNIGVSYDNETRKDYLRQAIIRLGALLTKSALPEAYQRLAAKQLWIIQYCYLKQLAQAKETELLIKKLNARAPAKNMRVATICPKDDE